VSSLATPNPAALTSVKHHKQPKTTNDSVLFMVKLSLPTRYLFNIIFRPSLGRFSFRVSPRKLKNAELRERVMTLRLPCISIFLSVSNMPPKHLLKFPTPRSFFPHAECEGIVEARDGERFVIVQKTSLSAEMSARRWNEEEFFLSIAFPIFIFHAPEGRSEASTKAKRRKNSIEDFVY
jgi:hypothetical protein